MSGLVLDGREIAVPFECRTWRSDPMRVPKATDFYPIARRACVPWTGAGRPPLWIRAIVLHTVHGRKGGTLREGAAPASQRDLWYAQYQARTGRDVSWDFTVDSDGSVAQSNDPLEHVSWHAGSVNVATLGIELVQESDGSLWRQQLEQTLVPLLDVLTRELRIQRQIPWHSGGPDSSVLRRFGDGGADRGGLRTVGIYGHRNQTQRRGFGDPTSWPFTTLFDAGYEGLDFRADEDRKAWRVRQAQLGIAVDGIPGPGTVAALEASGREHGLWVARPGD